MSFPMNRRGFLALAITTSLMAGCGTQQIGTPSATGLQEAPGYQIQNSDKDDDKSKKRGHGLKFLKGLELTEDQKEQLKTIKAEFDPEKDHGDMMKGWMERFETLMKAETVDVEAMNDLADDVVAKMKTLKTDYIDMLVDVRALLTEEQRDKAAENLREKAEKVEEKQEKHKAKKEKLWDDLELTDAQKASLTSIDVDMAENVNALAAFLDSGDRAALETAWTVEDLDSKVDEMVATLASLDQDTRKKLLERIEEMHKKMKEKKKDKMKEKKERQAEADDDDDDDDDEETGEA
ncbi:MAG: Spy/CpxP family protein refolding chaperone [Candidatus Sericytochromatia bacterium]